MFFTSTRALIIVKLTLETSIYGFSNNIGEDLQTLMYAVDLGLVTIQNFLVLQLHNILWCLLWIIRQFVLVFMGYRSARKVLFDALLMGISENETSLNCMVWMTRHRYHRHISLDVGYFLMANMQFWLMPSWNHVHDRILGLQWYVNGWQTHLETFSVLTWLLVRFPKAFDMVDLHPLNYTE